MYMIIILIAFLLLIVLCHRMKYDQRGFDKKGIHKNGTKYDDSGYDVRGYDRNGYDCQGYDANGYDCQGYDANGYDCKGYNLKGYNREGKNAKGQYNRFYDVFYSKDGFRDPKWYPIIVTNHAKQRMMERMSVQNLREFETLALKAYCYGKSKRQVKKSSAALMEEIEGNYENSILLIYSGYIYVFSKDNRLITVYRNDRIPL